MMTKKRQISHEKSILIILALVVSLMLLSIYLTSAHDDSRPHQHVYDKTTNTYKIVYTDNTQASGSGTNPSGGTSNANQKEPSSTIVNSKIPFPGIAGTGWGNWINEKVELWLHADLTTQTAEQRGALGDTLKFMLLGLVILLVYSALTFAQFPENGVYRLSTAITIGFLSTFLVTTQELLTMLSSYTALGVTLGVFLPIMILGFFTMMVANSSHPMGIFVQKIAWVIYSGYLFIKTFGLLWLRRKLGPEALDALSNKNLTPQQMENLDWSRLIPESTKAAADAAKKTWVDKIIDAIMNILEPIIKPLLPTTPTEVDQAKALLGIYSAQMLALLCLVSVAIFVIMVLGNDKITNYLIMSRENAAMQAYKSGLRLEKGRLNAINENMMGGSK